jgi:two-component system chemotaxis response regulator CheB
VGQLPADLKAAVFVVLHIPPSAPSVLSGILSRRGKLNAHPAIDWEPIQWGRIYVAVPDRHMILRAGPPPHGGHVRLTGGAAENGHRPAVDPLFRSAAVDFGHRVIGVVFSGNLDDGTAGLAAIKTHGGIAIAQSPESALYPGMPRSAVDNVALDHVLPVEAIGPLLVRLVAEPLAPVQARHLASNPAPRPVAEGSARDAEEVAMSELDPSLIHHHPSDPENRSPGGPGPVDPPDQLAGAPVGRPSGFGCPHCGGALFEITEHGFTRYRCRVGHAFSPESLMDAQNDGIERALWSALRALEESAAMCRRVAERAERRGNTSTVTRFTERSRHAREQAEAIRRMLARGGLHPPPD